MERKHIATIFLEIPKEAKSLPKFTNKDDIYHLAYKYVGLIPADGLLSATDSRILRSLAVSPECEWADEELSERDKARFSIFIDPTHILKTAGKKVEIQVFDEEREIKSTKKVGRQTVTTSTNVTFQVAEMICSSEKYVTDVRKECYPDVKRVTPRAENLVGIDFGKEGLEALKLFCKLLPPSCTGFVIKACRNDKRVRFWSESEDTSGVGTIIELAKESPVDLEIGLNSKSLLKCLDGCDGTILVWPDASAYSRPVLPSGCGSTLIMPINAENLVYKAEVRDFLMNRYPTPMAVGPEVQCVVEDLRGECEKYWEAICEYNEGNHQFTKGNYNADEVAGNRCGSWHRPADQRFEKSFWTVAGNTKLIVPYTQIFATLYQWESAICHGHASFSFGNVKEVTEKVLERGDNGELVEKKMRLRDLGNNWYSPMKRGKKDWEAWMYCKLNGHIIKAAKAPIDTIDDPEKLALWLGKHDDRKTLEALQRSAADTSNPYWAKLLVKIGFEPGEHGGDAQPTEPAPTTAPRPTKVFFFIQ